jgi:hypothetical protein
LVKNKTYKIQEFVYAKEQSKAQRFNAKKTAIIQSEPPSSRYEQKCDGLVCAKPNRNASAFISGQDAPFGLSFFALKPCSLAGSFAYTQSGDFEDKTTILFHLPPLGDRVPSDPKSN